MLLNWLLLAILLPFCTSIDSITLNQSITDGNVLLSKENYFALGFFSPGNSAYRYLGIWYHQVPEKTVVWVANRNNPINGSSGVILINQYGNLVLHDSPDRKLPLWFTNVSASVAEDSVAQLQDTGNFVLLQNNGKRVVWQSFDQPTDTMLPGTKLGLDPVTALDRFLTSWKSRDDPGTGEYSFKLVPWGSPQMFLINGSTRYWRTRPWPWIGVAKLLPSFIYDFGIVNNHDQKYFAFFLNDSSVFARIYLDTSGSVSLLTWHSSDGWKQYHSGPKGIKYGLCGANSKYDPNSINKFECSCLPGYEPKSPRDWYLRDGSGGCLRKHMQSSSLCGSGEGFVKVARAKVPDASDAAWVDMSMSSKDCEQACLRNCSCTAYASLDIPGAETGCLAWYGLLNDTWDYSNENNDGSDFYVRVDSIELAETAEKSKGFFRKKGKMIIPLFSGAVSVLLILIFAHLWLRKKRKIRVKKNFGKIMLGITGGLTSPKNALAAYDLDANGNHPDLPFVDLSTILAYTNNFSPANKLGQGGFGSVYKGQLSNRQEIAIKRLSKSSMQGIEEFKNEVMLIARLQHRNLVKLLGCCIEGEEQMLIYEYLANKSLDTIIFDQTRRAILDWRKRFDIIIGIARGILYLHQDSRVRIIHRDLKTSNVLLDAEMNPKISDFGMARIFKGDHMQEKTNKVVGTFGYMAPEYAAFGKFSIKSDVFSFGVIMLEIISGRKNNNSSEDPSMNLIEHAWELWKGDRAMDLVDSSLTESCIPPEVLRCIQIGLLCVQENAVDRPAMPAVVLMLNGETALPSAKQPAFIFRRNCKDIIPSTVAEGHCSINEVTITDIEAR